MDLFDISQFGVAIFAVGTLAYVVKKFLCYMKHQNETIENHIHHNTNAIGELRLSNQELSMVIKELLGFLKKNNGK